MELVLRGSELSLEKLKEYQESFIDYLDVDELTLKTYKVGIMSFINYLIENNINFPKRDDVINYRNMLRNNYSGSTVNTYMAGVKAMFKFLSIKGKCPNLAEDIKGSRYNDIPKKEVLSIEQLQYIYNHLTDKRERALFGLMISTGVRVCEISTANIEDIRQHNGEIVLFVLGKKRDSKSEYVKLSQQVLEDINNYIDGRTSGSIFISNSNINYGEGLSIKSLRNIIKNIFRRFGLDRDTLSCHSLRRSFAVISYESGSDIYSIKDVLRHKSINTTTRYLQQVNRDNNKTEYNVSNILLGGSNA